MSKKIRQLYRKSNLKAPDGKGMHTVAFHKCVVDIKRKMRAGDMPKGTNPYAICMESIGKKGAVKKSHRR